MATLPDPPGPIFEGEPPSPLTPGSAAPREVTLWPLLAMLAGNTVLAFGPWLVRLADVGPIASGFWRLAIALPVLAAIGWRTGRGKVAFPPLVLGLTAVAGLCFALDLATWHAGILHTRLANATLFGNSTSFFFVAYGFLLARRWPSRTQAVALLLAAAGVALLMGRSFELSPDHIAGDLLCLSAGLFYTGYMVAVDRVRGRLGTWPTLAAATLVGTITLLPLAWLAGDTIWPHHWSPLVALALGSQVLGQGLIVYVIGALPPTIVGLGLLSQPIVAATIGWIAYGETLTAGDLIGAAAIAAALVLIRKRD